MVKNVNNAQSSQQQKSSNGKNSKPRKKNFDRRFAVRVNFKPNTVKRPFWRYLVTMDGDEYSLLDAVHLGVGYGMEGNSNWSATFFHRDHKESLKDMSTRVYFDVLRNLRNRGTVIYDRHGNSFYAKDVMKDVTLIGDSKFK